MKDLLQKWSEIEPERCTPYGPNEIGRFHGETGYKIKFHNHWRYFGDDADGHARLHVAVQQAIWDRRWNCSIRLVFGVWCVAVSPVKNFSHEIKSNLTCAKALLSAYLQALEATKADEVAA